MNEYEKLKIVVTSLKEGISLSMFSFTDDKAILRDESGVMYCSDVLFYKNKAMFINIKQKEDTFLTNADIF